MGRWWQGLVVAADVHGLNKITYNSFKYINHPGLFMRKFLFLMTGIILSGHAFSQIPDDVVKNAWFVPNGTARSISVGGAIGALGGDITSVYVNPAGLGFYKTREVVFSPSIILNNNKSDYRQTTSDNIKKIRLSIRYYRALFSAVK